MGNLTLQEEEIRKKRLAEIGIAAYKERLTWLWLTKAKLIKFKMNSTGSPRVDLEVIKKCGDWQTWKEWQLAIEEYWFKFNNPNVVYDNKITQPTKIIEKDLILLIESLEALYVRKFA